MGEASLAIVIPAWKPDFLRHTLASLGAQTDHSFHIYIGDDDSPFDLARIVESSGLGALCSYTRFETNLGGHDLPGQWERCIALTRGETWIWLFSDDDIASPECVAAFQASVLRNPEAVLHHFGVQRIDSEGAPLGPIATWNFETPSEFVLARLEDRLTSFAIEYVFRHDSLQAVGGFPRFDLAWGTDDATWLELSRLAPPAQIPGAHVSWRESSVNISVDARPDLVIRRSRARLQFLAWARERGLTRCDRPNPFFHAIPAWYLGSLRPFVTSIRYPEILELIAAFAASFELRWPTRWRWTLDLFVTKWWRQARTRIPVRSAN